MSPKIMRSLLVIVLTVSSTTTHAQVRIENKWDSEQRTIIIDSHIPPNCDQAMFGARDHLREVEPAMSMTYTWNALPDAGPDETTTVNRASFGYGGAVTAGQTNLAFTGAGFFESYGQFVDGDILVNHDLIYWPATTDAEGAYDFWCDSAQGAFASSQIDYQSMFVHELGHLVGFKHRTDASSGSCVMHEQQRRGVYNRSLCPDERSAYQDAY